MTNRMQYSNQVRQNIRAPPSGPREGVHHSHVYPSRQQDVAQNQRTRQSHAESAEEHGDSANFKNEDSVEVEQPSKKKQKGKSTKGSSRSGSKKEKTKRSEDQHRVTKKKSKSSKKSQTRVNAQEEAQLSTYQDEVIQPQPLRHPAPPAPAPPTAIQAAARKPNHPTNSAPTFGHATPLFNVLASNAPTSPVARPASAWTEANTHRQSRRDDGPPRQNVITTFEEEEDDEEEEEWDGPYPPQPELFMPPNVVQERERYAAAQSKGRMEIGYS